MTDFFSKLSLVLALPVLLLTSCGPKLSPFTQRLYEDQRWSESDLERIQFYLSEDIVLTRELRGGSSDIIRGEIKIVDGREVEQLVIRRKTPGVFLFSPRDERFAISFEEGGEDRFLIFGPNPRAGGRYTLRASDWNRRSGTVTYDGRKWRVSSSDAYAALMIDMKRIRNQNVRSRVAGGRRIE